MDAIRNDGVTNIIGGGVARALNNPPVNRGPGPAPADGRAWRNFADPARRADASISAFWSSATNWGGVTKFRWRKPGEPITLNMSVDVKSGDPGSVIAQVWTNINHNGDPDTFQAYDMKPKRDGNKIGFEATIPVNNIGNYRAVGRISVDGGKTWRWMSEFGKADLRFRARAVEHEAINEQVVHVGMANCAPGAWGFSKIADLTDEVFGNYNLDALRAAGKNTIRLQPPFRSDPWDRRHPYDTAGSPYAATDFFAIDPRMSRDCEAQGIPSWDRDRAMKAANAEMKRFIDKAHEKGFKVIFDIALNHTGHNFTYRDYFENRAEGDRVMRNNFSQIAVNPEQLRVVEERLKHASADAYAEELFPKMYASKHGDPWGADSVFDTVAAGNGEWADTKQLNSGSWNYGCYENLSPQSEKVLDWMGRIMQYWVNDMGVDGFRLDHATNLPMRFYDHVLNQVQAKAKKPIAIIGEDFNQNGKIGPYLDALEAGWYRGLVQSAKAYDAGAIRGIVDSDFFQESLRTGNHDEHRIINDFDGDVMAATRFECLLALFGGWTTSLFGDELGEGKQFEFKHAGSVPPTLWAARMGTLPSANKDMQFWIGKAGWAKTSFDALKTSRRVWLDPMRGPQNDVVACARHADASNETVFLFGNLSNSMERENQYRIDNTTRGRIDPNKYYNVRDLMSLNPGRMIWPTAIKGQDLLNNGIYMKLAPYQIQALKLEVVG